MTFLILWLGIFLRKYFSSRFAFPDWHDDFILNTRYLTWLNMPLHIIHQPTETLLISAHTLRRRNETIFSLLDKTKNRWLQTFFSHLRFAMTTFGHLTIRYLAISKKKNSRQLFTCPCIISPVLSRLTPEGERQCQKAQGFVVWVLCQERFGRHFETCSLLSRWFIVGDILQTAKAESG